MKSCVVWAHPVVAVLQLAPLEPLHPSVRKDLIRPRGHPSAFQVAGAVYIVPVYFIVAHRAVPLHLADHRVRRQRYEPRLIGPQGPLPMLRRRRDPAALIADAGCAGDQPQITVHPEVRRQLPPVRDVQDHHPRRRAKVQLALLQAVGLQPVCQPPRQVPRPVTAHLLRIPFQPEGRLAHIGKLLPVIFRVESQCQPDLFQIIRALDPPRLLLGRSQRRQKQTRQHRDDRCHHQHLHQGEPLCFFFRFSDTFLHIPVYIKDITPSLCIVF